MNHMRTIGSRKISDTSNSDAYAPQRTAAGVPSGSRFQLSMLIRLWRGHGARLIDAQPRGAGRRGSILPAVKNRGQNVLNTAQLQQAMFGDYLGGRAARRFAGTLLRLLVTGFLVLAASNNCRMPCSNSPTAFSKAPSCPIRTMAMDGRRSNDGGRNTFTLSIE